jgi:hypothetical protein
MVRKTFWIERQTEWRLRREAYDSRVTEAEIVRAVLREYFGLRGAESTCRQARSQPSGRYLAASPYPATGALTTDCHRSLASSSNCDLPDFGMRCRFKAWAVELWHGVWSGNRASMPV